MTERILIGSDASSFGAPGDETSSVYYQEGDRLIIEHWGSEREADPNEVVSELFTSLHALKDCKDPVDVSRRDKYQYLVKQIILRYQMLYWKATFSDRKDCIIYATSRGKAHEKAVKLGDLKSLQGL